MKDNLKLHRGHGRKGPITVLAALAIVCLVLAFAPSKAFAKVYIDIVSAPRKLPIAIQTLTGPRGREISEIIADDLDFSGLFLTMDREAFLEKPGEPFKRGNWTGTGAEAVVKGTVTEGEEIVIEVMLYDVFEGHSILQRKYKAHSSMLRPLAHAVAGDIYQKITGRESVFRTKVAYITRDEDGHRLNVADWDGMRRRKLGITGNAILAPHWSEDGRKLLYSAQKGRGWSIFMLDLDRKKETLVFSSQGTNIAGDFLPGGDSFALSSSRTGSPDIYTYHIRSRKLTRLTSHRGIEVSPSVTRDGKMVAFVSDRGGTPQIYTMDKFGYNKTRITFEGRYNTSPAWSPRGDMLAFCGRYEGKNHIFIIKPDGSGLQRLTSDGNNEEPAFSPDGRFLAFTSDRDGMKGIYTMRVTGEDQRRVTPRGITAFGASWSPE